MMFSGKVLGIQESFLNKWDSDVKYKIAEGKSVLQFNLGQPDFACPEFVKEAIKIVNGKDKNNFYNHTGGTDKLRFLLADLQKKTFGLEYNKEEVIVTNGAKEALFLAFAAILNGNDEVIVVAPHWPTYVEQVKFFGGLPVVVDITNNFGLNIEAIKKAVNENTKAIVINNPNNPVGMIYGREDIGEIVELAEKHNLIIISDEVYNSTVFDGKKHISVADFPGAKERAIVIDGFSKTLSMTGYRLGFAFSSREIIDNMIKVKSNINGNTNSFFQMVVEEVLANHFEDYLRFVDMAKGEYLKRRDFLCESLDGMKMEYKKPEGTFYLFAKIPKGFDMGSREFVESLLEKTGIAVAPGIFFGKSFDNYFRISFGTSMEDIVEGVKRMKKFLEETRH
ncbi:MAG: pyridoxal phosphate-dependent aminotransferase [Candidatus Pacebacteria bacterium]|nr:pyridoxal phosphate-dependent aminotransferase [Candidatus Paceibacterota bacterium]